MPCGVKGTDTKYWSALHISVIPYTVTQNFQYPVEFPEISVRAKVVAEAKVNHSEQPYYLCQLLKTQILLNEQLLPVAKSCGVCGRMQTLDSYYKDRAVLGRATSCAECRRKSSKQYRQSHKEYFRNYMVQNRLQLLDYRRQWYKQNQQKIAEYAARQKRRAEEISKKLLPDDKKYMQKIEDQEHYCQITGVAEDVQLDHILPLVKGSWGNTEGNLMYLYAPLNKSKNSNNVFDWLEQMDQERLDYLLPDDCKMTVEQFQQKYLSVLERKAAEKGLSLAHYKEWYTKEYQSE